jgi:predicted Ser/Thr protein kinase
LSAAASAEGLGGRLEPADTSTYGRYVAIRQIGSGAVGAVFEAVDPLLSRRVALKILRPDFPADGEAVAELHARLLREAQALARLAHPNVVAVYDVGRKADQVYVAMEFVDGTTLGDWVRAEARSWPEILDVFLQAARGLAAAHEAGVIHRDFKPANVLVGRPGRVCVTDFGLARVTDGGPASLARAGAGSDGSDESADELLTRAGKVLGSPAFMAPEQLAGDPADGRSDLFSFCVSLWEALYGERPFRARSLGGLRIAMAEGRVRPAPAGSTVPDWLRDVLVHGLRHRPEDRPPGMTALIAELERERTHEGLSRAERILREAEEFFPAHEKVRAVSSLAVSLLQGAMAVDAPVNAARERISRPDLPHLARVEISGRRLRALMEALGPYRAMLSHLFARAGFEADPDGMVRFDVDRWYPYVTLMVFNHRDSFGPDAAYDVGRTYARVVLEGENVPRGLDFDPRSFELGEEAFNRGMRLDGLTLDGLSEPLGRAAGYRAFERLGPGVIGVTAVGTARCATTRGYYAAVCEHFGHDTTVEHVDGPCRDQGGAECRYRMTLVRAGPRR